MKTANDRGVFPTKGSMMHKIKCYLLSAVKAMESIRIPDMVIEVASSMDGAQFVSSLGSAFSDDAFHGPNGRWTTNPISISRSRRERLIDLNRRLRENLTRSGGTTEALLDDILEWPEELLYHFQTESPGDTVHVTVADTEYYTGDVNDVSLLGKVLWSIEQLLDLYCLIRAAEEKDAMQ